MDNPEKCPRNNLCIGSYQLVFVCKIQIFPYQNLKKKKKNYFYQKIKCLLFTRSYDVLARNTLLLNAFDKNINTSSVIQCSLQHLRNNIHRQTTLSPPTHLTNHTKNPTISSISGYLSLHLSPSSKNRSPDQTHSTFKISPGGDALQTP